MDTPAIMGGRPVFAKRHRWPRWPFATKRDEARLLRVVRGGRWGIGCPQTQAFAEAFAASLNVKYVLPVSTGTAALELAVKALGVGPGDEVIVPAYTFVATATCGLQMGATVVFADIEPDTMLMDPKHVAALITERTRAIIPVHFAGNPCDMAALKSLARGRGIALIEDAAHAHGMLYRGKAGGTLGRVGCFSFQSSKNMASGEGGALATRSRRLYEAARSYHSFGRRPGGPWYEHEVLSWNQRMTGFQSALLLGQLERLASQTRRRRRNGEFLNRALSAIPGQTHQKQGDVRSGTRRAYHLYMWRFDAGAVGIRRDLFLAALRAEGVPVSGGYPIPLQRNAMFLMRRFWHRHRGGGAPREQDEPDYAAVTTPVAEKLCSEAVWLPQECLLAPRSDMQGIVDAVARIVSHADEMKAHGAVPV